MKKLLLAFTLATLSGCAIGTVKPVADQQSAVENNESEALETWECSERHGSSKTLVTATILTDEIEGAQLGTIEVAGITHLAVYTVEGFNRRWDFGMEEDNTYAFVIEPDGDSTYYDFEFADDNGIAKGRLFFKCKQK